MARRKLTFGDAHILDLLRLPLAGVASYLAIERLWWFARRPHPIVYLVTGALCAVAALVLVLQLMQHQAGDPVTGGRIAEIAMPVVLLVLPLGICGAASAGGGGFSRVDRVMLVVTTVPVLLGLTTELLYESTPIAVRDATGDLFYTADLTPTGGIILAVDIVLGGGYVFWTFRRDRGLLIRSSRNVLRLAGALAAAAAINDLLLWEGHLDSVNLFDFGLAGLSLSFSWAYYKRSTLEIRDLEHQRQSREVFLARQVDAQEAERARIARELHDATGQKLASLLMRMHALERDSPEGVGARITELRELTRETADELRRISRGLHPAVLDDLGLAAALRACAEEIESAHDLHIDVVALDRAGARLEPDVELGVYRIAQEALNNAARHAGAQRASVMIEWHAARVRLIVEDDGVGMDGESSSGLGLQSMRDRAEFLGGDLSVESSANGTTVCATIPLVEGARQGGQREGRVPPRRAPGDQSK